MTLSNLLNNKVVMAGLRAGHPGSVLKRVSLGGRVKPGHDEGI